MKIQINPRLTIGSATFRRDSGKVVTLLPGETVEIARDEYFAKLGRWRQGGLLVLVPVDSVEVIESPPETEIPLDVTDPDAGAIAIDSAGNLPDE